MYFKLHISFDISDIKELVFLHFIAKNNVEF